ncbi:hypothetical protein BYT27DRAFT_7288895 [Phlegmacium glaucopus]|nr:hypothetical protein BYT27DRAFT_7288895 [Phlegmacium glaucopus]
MDTVEPLSIPNVSSPPPLPPRRKLPNNVSDNNASVLAVPPPLPLRKVPGGLGDYSQTDDSHLLPNLEDAEENELNEKQLRELYDNEEIDRFLTLFSDYVTEVQVVDAPGTENSIATHVLPPGPLEHKPEDEEWTPISSLGEISSPPSVIPTPSTTTPLSKNWSEEIACQRYILPILPRARPSPPPFTIGRLRLAAQRIYLAILPAYGPFFSQLASLATWEDSNTSLIYCSIYWILWWYNFLIPALVLRVIFALLKRRIFPHPSLEDLRQHREEVIRANEFGDQVSARLSATSTGVTEVFHLFKLFDQRRKKTAKQKAKDMHSANPTEDIGDMPISEDALDKGEAADIKGIIVYALNEIADLHERVRNIFLWRRPASSRIYGVVLCKLTFFVLGFIFWHVVPIIVSLPPSDIERLPPAFHDVPTDVEYAMQLMSQRVAAGLEIKPPKSIKRDRLHQPGTSVEPLPEGSGKAGLENPINWKKWGNRVALGKSAVGDIAGFKFGNPRPVPEVGPVETHTYPCQHSSAPGLITLTQNTMVFTPLLRQDAKIIITLTAIKRVKKVGMLKGLQIRWNDVSGDREDKFLWIGERDDLFARIMGLDGRRWIQI